MADAPLLDTLIRETGPDPRCSIVWLHGLGADGNDFLPIVPELVPRHWPPLRFVFPHAPVRPVTINGGVRMRAWYDIIALDIAARQDHPGIDESCRQVEALIAREVERGIPAERVILAGFSQGGAIALALGLRRRPALRGLVALSTYLAQAEQVLPALADGKAPPVFLAHGQYDPVIPVALGLATRDALRAAGVQVQWQDYPMQHSVSGQEILDLRAWLEPLVT